MKTVFPIFSLSDLSDSIIYGYTASAKKEDNGVKFLRITDIQDGSVDWNSVPFCLCNSQDIKKYFLKNGDIVIARTGATTGKSYLINNSPEQSIFASYLIRVRHNEKVEPRYLAHFFETPMYWQQIQENSNGATLPGVNASKLKELKVPLPPLVEQKRIAAILDKANAIRRERQDAIKLADDFLRATFLDMFGDPVTNPKGWPVKSFREISKIFSDGPFGSNLKSSHYVNKGVRVIRLQNIGVGRFVDDNQAYISEEHFNSLDKYECLPGDVLIGTLGEPNLRACLLPTYINKALNKADCIQLRPMGHCATSEYISSLINQPGLLSLSSYLLHGQTRTRISMGTLRELLIPVPPLSMQQKFTMIYHQVDNIKSRSNKLLFDKKVLFNSLIQRAFRGEI